jgi:cobalt/nickel transport system ATP-binding protein
MRMDANLPLIRLQGIHFSYPERPPVLNGADFDFHKGERIGLIGSNGSGKTTFFQIIMGLLKPDSGGIEIFGKQRKEGKDFQEVRERIGILFQDPDDQLFSPTVAEDIAFGPLNLGKTREEAMKIVHDTLNLLGIGGFEERITYRLSGGEKKLVSLATVLAMQPEILLLDEPVAGLDDYTKERLMNFMKTPALSYIIVSHDTDFLLETTNTLYKLQDGLIKRVGHSLEQGPTAYMAKNFRRTMSCLLV